ncbi:MAG: glycine cleavage system protein GcvH [Acidobacteria bacterium]|nr:glycine cleavage system protein GcvH [Acidobacteriota bacterium]
MYPKDYLYTKDHEWVKVDGDIGTVGITDYAQHELGDVVYVELPNVGDKFRAGESFATVESVKAVSEVYAPVSGEVVEVNETLADHPEKVNEDPYGEGWFVKLKIEVKEELDDLFDAARYEAYIKEEKGE